MIIDAHVHVGKDRVFDHEQTENQVVQAMDTYGIDTAIVQPFVDSPTIDVARNSHNRIAKMAEENPKKIFGMISLNPHLPEKQFRQEVTRCVEELEFVAIKLSPIAHACNPLSEDGMRIFELADKLGIPAMIHTGSGIPFALPSLMIPVARKFPRLKIILAHAGGNIAGREALVAAQECKNIFLEPSWVGVHTIKGWIKQIGPERIMFGSDMIENCPVELTKFKSIGLSETELQQCLYKTAKDVFDLPV